ncbi:MAG: M48 family metalloprotease [Bacteroidetes bacterium]|nr:M48 family metalloprotease [Bacteroidota bacterium]
MKKQVSTLSFVLIVFLSVLSFTSCKKSDLNLFTIDDDKTFGLQMEAEIASKPSEYPLLDKTAYPASYAYLESMKSNILNSGKLDYASDFAWKLYIIRDDAVQNAFCTPGGYIYIYTGLIKYLDNASSLAGVMGHEMAHADQRHSTRQMTEQFGITTLLEIVLGQNQNALSDIAAQLSVLAFSRADETDADKHSVKYLCPTLYRSDGAADFFQKIINSGASSPPAFLSTHPNPDNRVANIQKEKTDLGCASTPSNQLDITDYASFKASLP